MNVCNTCSVCITHTHTNLYEEYMLPILIAAPHYVDWFKLSADPQEWMLPLMIENPDMIWWPALYDKPCCITSTPGIRHNLQSWMLPLLLAKDPREIDWCTLHLPFHFREWMLPFMIKYQDELNWSYIHVESWMEPLHPPRVTLEQPLRVPMTANFDQCRCECSRSSNSFLDQIDGLTIGLSKGLSIRQKNCPGA